MGKKGIKERAEVRLRGEVKEELRRKKREEALWES